MTHTKQIIFPHLVSDERATEIVKEFFHDQDLIDLDDDDVFPVKLEVDTETADTRTPIEIRMTLRFRSQQ